MNRLIEGMPEGFAAQLRSLESKGEAGTEAYAALAQQFYDRFVLRTPPTPDVLASFESLSKSIAYRVMNGPNEFTITGTIRDWDRTRDLHRIRTDTLVMTGEFDEVTLDCHQSIRDGVSGKAQLTVMSGASHMTMCEKPELHNDLVRRFIREV